MKKFLVTGGAGFIGSHLCDALLHQGHEVVVLDNMTSGRVRNLASAGSRIKFIEGDVRELPEHAAAIGHVDAVFHLAALISGRDSLFEPDQYLDVNVAGTLRVIEFVAERRIPRILFASSSTVYGDAGVEQISEEVLPRPVTVYALSKLAGEHLLSLYGRMHGFSHVSLRLFNVYGPRQAIDHPYANVTCKFSHAAATGGTVQRYGDGEQTRDFIYVDDVVDVFLRLADGSRDSIYNVGTGSDASINSLLDRLEEISGSRIPVEQHAEWPNDVRRVCADSTRLQQELGFRAPTGMREGLASTVDFFKRCA
jgi:UDP-glucose 4-epimerase